MDLNFSKILTWGKKNIDNFSNSLDQYRKVTVDGALTLVMASPTIVRIRDDWDSFPDPSNLHDNSVYVGRVDDLKKLSNWILHSTRGSLLLSGVRGIGKTSFVYRAFNEAKKKNNNIKIIEINGANLLRDGEEKSLTLLKAIIQSCYHINELNKNFESLYALSYSQLESKTKTSSLFSFTLNPRITLGFELVITLLTYLVLEPIFSRYVIFSFFYIDIAKVLALSTSVIAAKVTGSFLYKRTKDDVSELTITSKNPEYLTAMLKAELTQKKAKYLFVIDELDKLESAESLENVIKSIKNLITISDAKFIFICDDQKYVDIKSKVTEDDPYPASSTLFNWEMFLPALDPHDIEEFLTKICADQIPDNHKLHIKELSYYIYSQTAGIPAKVKNSIRDFISYKEDSTFLNFAELKEEKVKFARIAKIYYQVLKNFDYKESSKQQLNHDRREILFYFLKKIMSNDNTFGGNRNIHQILNDLKNPANKRFEVTGKDKELLVKEIITLFSDINDMAQTSEPLNNPKIIDGSQNIVFSIDMSEQVTPSIEDVKKNKFTDLESQLSLVSAKTNQKIRELGEKIGNTNYSKVLSLLDKNYLSIFDSINSVTSSMSINKLMDQSVIRNRLEEASEINNKLSSTGEFLRNYFDNSLSENINVVLKNNQLLFNSINNNYSKIINVDKLSNFTDTSKILEEVIKSGSKKYQDYQFFGNWTTKQVEENLPQKQDVYELPLFGKFSFKELNFRFETINKYWRVGLALGHTKENLQPLGGSQYTLFHIYRDEQVSGLNYRRYERVDEKKKIEGQIITDIKEIDASSLLNVNIRLTKKARNNSVQIKVNDQAIETFELPDSDRFSASLLVWTDDRVPKEPIVIENIMLLTREEKRK